MGMFEIMAWIIVTIISLIIAPLMTIGIIFIGAGWNAVGFIFIILGVINMFYRIYNLNDGSTF